LIEAVKKICLSFITSRTSIFREASIDGDMNSLNPWPSIKKLEKCSARVDRIID
jgi:hypothetical protein